MLPTRPLSRTVPVGTALTGVLLLGFLASGALPAAAQGHSAPRPIVPKMVGPQDAIDGHPGNPVATTLNAFGVSTDPTPREDEQHQELDSSYSPLGSEVTLNRTDELVIVGLDQPGDDYQSSFFLYQDGTDGLVCCGEYASEVLYTMGPNEMEDFQPATTTGRAPQSYRAVAAADLGRDGLDEVLVLYRQGTELRLRVVRDQQHDFATSDSLVAVESNISDVAVAAADLDGDGKAEVIAAWAVDGVGVRLEVLRSSPSGFVSLGQRTILPSLAGSAFSLVLKTGNVDNDRYSEIVLVVDENADPLGLCRWFLYDDLRAGGVRIGGGSLSSTDAGVTRTAVVGDVALGDIDGDGRDEVLLAGLTSFTHGCEGPDYLVLALDDAEYGFAQLGTRHFHYDYGPCGSASRMVRWAHINTGDFDGDGRDEIQMNQWIYEDWIDGGTWNAAWSLPDSVVMAGTSRQYFDRSTSAFTVGDFTGDGHANVMTVRNGVHDVQVYGLQLPAPDPQFVNMGHVPAEAYAVQSGLSNPLLLTVNVDTDSPVLSYTEARYQFVFTEPVVIAALAAPPYELGIAQNYQACSTAFGNTVSSGSESERTVSVSAGVSVGVNLDGGFITQSEFELSESLTVAASQVSSHAYQLDRTILFQSGWDEDLVVFTTIPTDVYTYKILSHPDPAMVGKSVVVRFPREQIILQADRAYYNEHLLEGGMRVDDAVFHHTIGDVSSYPTRSQKNALLAMHPGLQHGPVSVGQGTGSTQVTIQVADAWSSGGALEVSYELEVKATGGGAMAGFTVGASASDSLQISSGTQTTYTGTVGAIAGNDFAANQYQFGLFTYVLPEPTRGYEFEVLNYWVE